MSIKQLKSEQAKDNFRKYRANYNREYYGMTRNLYPRKVWDQDEDEMILKHEITDSELSVILSRSVSAIQERRCRLRKENG